MTKTKRSGMSSRISAIVAVLIIGTVLSLTCVERATAQPGNVVISGQQYWVDAGEADQGVTGNGKTVKALADLIGTTTLATLVFDSKTGASASYVFTTAWNGTTYSNLHFEFKNGATLAPGSGVTNILPSPSNIIANPVQRIFSGAGNNNFARSGTVYPDWWGTNTTPGTTEMLTAIQSAIDSVSAAGGGDVFFQGGIYRINGSIICKRSVNLTGINHESTRIYAPGAITAIVIDATVTYDSSYLTIKGFAIYGDLTAGSIGVRIGGTALVGYDIFDRCYIHHFETGVSMQSGIFINFVRCMIQYNVVGVEWKTTGSLYNTTTSFEYCTIHSNTHEGFKRTSKGSYHDKTLNLIGCTVQANGNPVEGTLEGWYQLDISSWRYVEINAIYMEHSGVVISTVTYYPYAIVANDCNNVVINAGQIEGSKSGFASSNIDGLVINGLQTRSTMDYGVYLTDNVNCLNISLLGCVFDKAPTVFGKNRMDVHSNKTWLQPSGYGTFGVGIYDPNIREIIAFEASGDFAEIAANSSLDSADIAKTGINNKTAMMITPITDTDTGLLFIALPLSDAGAANYYRIRAINVTTSAINPGSITWRIVAIVMDN